MGQKYALNRNRTGLRMAFRSKIDPVTGLPLHRHSLKLPGKWKTRKSFICLHTSFSSGNRSKLFSKECATRSTSPAMLQGEGAVWNLLEFLSDNFGFFFFHGVPFCVSTCDGQAIFTSHSIMWWKFWAGSVSAAL